MGCNSHLAIDVRGEWRPDEWECFAEHVMESRWYMLYAHMAGVRNYSDLAVTPIAADRGYPADVSEGAQDFIHTSADHSITWLTPNEYATALKRAGGDAPTIAESKSWYALEKILFALEEVYGVGNVRLIVGFDN